MTDNQPKVKFSTKNDNIVLIIGNGFNLDLKFESKYSDFAKSEEWKELYEKYASKSNHYSLIKFLNDRKETDKWFDIEQALFEYAALKTADIWHHDVSNDIQEYHALCRQLEKYFIVLSLGNKNKSKLSFCISLVYAYLCILYEICDNSGRGGLATGTGRCRCTEASGEGRR